MSDGTRCQVLTTFADTLISLIVGHPTRVAIDGRTASGNRRYQN
jgi:hypothetical protein